MPKPNFGCVQAHLGGDFYALWVAINPHDIC